MVTQSDLDAIRRRYGKLQLALRGDDASTHETLDDLMAMFSRDLRFMEYGEMRVSGVEQLRARIDGMLRYHKEVHVQPMVLSLETATDEDGAEVVHVLYAETAYLVPRLGKRLFRTSLENHRWRQEGGRWKIDTIERRIVNVYDID